LKIARGRKEEEGEKRKERKGKKEKGKRVAK
jgi:hypothetical protein